MKFFLAAAAGEGGLPLDWMGLPAVSAVLGLYLALAALGAVIDAVLLYRFARRPPRWREHTAWLLARPWTVRNTAPVFLTLAALFLLLLTVDSLLYRWRGEAWSEGTGWLVVESVALHWSTLFLVLFLLKRRGLRWGRAFGFHTLRIGRDIRVAVITYLAALPVLVFFSAAAELLLRRLGQAPEVQPVVELLADAQSPWLIGYFVFLAVVLAPFVEEILFRGLALPVLARRIGFGPAVVIVSALFALLHGQVTTFVPLFLLSAAFCLAYLSSRSLLAPIVMHAVFNAINVAMLLVLRWGQGM